MVHAPGFRTMRSDSCGKKEMFYANFEQLRPTHRARFKTHVVARGRRYPGSQPLSGGSGTDAEISKLKKTSRLSIGMHLLIPVPAREEPKAQVTARVLPTGRRPQRTPRKRSTRFKGDSLWSIANELGITIGSLSQWNNLHPARSSFRE
jgi:hypothetical protein